MGLEFICAKSIPARTILTFFNNASHNDRGQSSGQDYIAHQGEMTSDDNNHGSPAAEQFEFENCGRHT
ncbi:uncharacterized protein FFNC_15658 [Fusarium fujikuroi]|nr:uncharacterized protein FFNC_15658 [Fusarium fujikuroi]